MARALRREWTEQPVTLSMNPWDNALLCPRCGGDNLHQGAVEVWDRGEDAATGTHVRISPWAGGDGVVVGSDMGDNPSMRRQGLGIGFSCEHCPDIPLVLHIVQHKGTTYLRWARG